MDDSLKDIHEHMLGLGLGALRHALRLTFYSHTENPYWGELAVCEAAHAAEILIKARIAQEHPLLIFEGLPKISKERAPILDRRLLFEHGKTIDFSDLPERLWAAAGIVLPNKKLFLEFGHLRNGIQHFAPSAVEDLMDRCLEFVFHVIDPFINDCWKLYAIDYNEDFGDHYEVVFEALIEREMRFNISPKAAIIWKEQDPGQAVSQSYRNWFEQAMSEALKSPGAQPG